MSEIFRIAQKEYRVDLVLCDTLQLAGRYFVRDSRKRVYRVRESRTDGTISAYRVRTDGVISKTLTYLNFFDERLEVLSSRYHGQELY